jgi:hypothetical protein
MAACNVGTIILFVQSILWDLNVPQEAATLLYEDNDGCTAMGNAQKPTPRTRHIDIKYFLLCKWVEHDLLLLECTNTSINMADHLTKHADFLLGYVPPQYSPIYSHIFGTFANFCIDIDRFTPQSFTTPITAAATPVHAPLQEDYIHSLWLHVIGHGSTIHSFHDSLTLSSSLHSVHSGLWGGDTI